MSGYGHVRDRFRIQIDNRAVWLGILFLVVIDGAGAVALALTNMGAAEPAFQGASSSGQAAGGAAWAIGEALFAGVLLGCILLWRRFPEWLQNALMGAVKFGVPMLIGGYVVTKGLFWAGLIGVVGLVIVLKIAEAFDLWWVVNNLLALGLAMYVAASVGVVLGPLVIGVALVGLSVYDYLFADRRKWMFTLAAWTVRRKLPALFIVPSTWRLDWDELADSMEGDDEQAADVPVEYGIGMADLALPAAFVVAVTHGSGSLYPWVGATAGILVACARVSFKLESGGGAGLPPLTSGTIGGWAIAAGVGVVV